MVLQLLPVNPVGDLILLWKFRMLKRTLSSLIFIDFVFNRCACALLHTSAIVVITGTSSAFSGFCLRKKEITIFFLFLMFLVNAQNPRKQRINNIRMFHQIYYPNSARHFSVITVEFFQIFMACNDAVFQIHYLPHCLRLLTWMVKVGLDTSLSNSFFTHFV